MKKLNEQNVYFFSFVFPALAKYTIAKLTHISRGILLFILLASSEYIVADLPKDPAPIPHGGIFMASLEVMDIGTGIFYCNDSIQGMPCDVTAPSVDQLIEKIYQTAAAYAAKYHAQNNWANCDAQLTEFIDTLGGWDGERDGLYLGRWGIITGTTCGVYLDYKDVVSWECPEGYTFSRIGYFNNTRHCYPNYVAITLPDPPPPQMCVGNPVEVGTGAKYQVESVIPSKGVGQVFLEQHYGNANSTVTPAWHHNYEKQITIIDPTQSNTFLKKSGVYFGSMEEACVKGWKDIKDTSLANSYAQFIDGKCKVYYGGRVVKTVPIVWNKTFTPSGTRKTPDAVKVVLPNGSANIFQRLTDNVFVSLDGQPSLERLNTNPTIWRYKLNNSTIEDYSADGRLLSITAPNGVKQTLTYNASTQLLERVVDSTGGALTFAYTGGRLTSITTSDNKVTTYAYNTAGLLNDIKHPDNTHRLYHYEDTHFPAYLTGITDERGKRYATWSFDAQGRAITSEHANGAEKTQLTFNADGSTTVTNELNKQTIYRFVDIAGARRVETVEGQPTANCLAAYQAYGYTPEGWVWAKTDWNGSRTNYTYNTNGQETVRVEAVNTPHTRTIKTEWDPQTNRKTKITDADSVTTFTYNTDGTLKSQLVSPIVSQ